MDFFSSMACPQPDCMLCISKLPAQERIPKMQEQLSKLHEMDDEECEDWVVTIAQNVKSFPSQNPSMAAMGAQNDSYCEELLYCGLMNAMYNVIKSGKVGHYTREKTMQVIFNVARVKQGDVRFASEFLRRENLEIIWDVIKNGVTCEKMFGLFALCVTCCTIRGTTTDTNSLVNIFIGLDGVFETLVELSDFQSSVFEAELFGDTHASMQCDVVKPMWDDEQLKEWAPRYAQMLCGKAASLLSVIFSLCHKQPTVRKFILNDLHVIPGILSNITSPLPPETYPDSGTSDSLSSILVHFADIPFSCFRFAGLQNKYPELVRRCLKSLATKERIQQILSGVVASAHFLVEDALEVLKKSFQYHPEETQLEAGTIMNVYEDQRKVNIQLLNVLANISEFDEAAKILDEMGADKTLLDLIEFEKNLPNKESEFKECYGGDARLKPYQWGYNHGRVATEDSWEYTQLGLCALDCAYVTLTNTFNFSRCKEEMKTITSCNLCGKSKPEVEHLGTCKGCKKVKYCSSEHQAEDWKNHKEHCKQDIPQEFHTSSYFSEICIEKYNRAVILKGEGNTHFKEKSFELAIECYTMGLRMLELLSGEPAQQLRLILWSNRSECLLKTKSFKHSLRDAEFALEVDSTHEKSLNRKLRAQEGLRSSKNKR